MRLFKKLDTQYPDHEIIGIDEASFQLTTTYKKIWFPRRETPRAAFFLGSSKKLITFGALTSKHKFFYDFYDSKNSLTFKYFLTTLFNKLNKKRKYVLILGNVGYHNTSCVTSLLQDCPHIAIEHLPLYSSELNLIELCWKITKCDVTKITIF